MRYALDMVRSLEMFLLKVFVEQTFLWTMPCLVPRGDFRNFTALVLREVCNDVLIEPQLQPLSGESLQGGSVNTSEGARLGIPTNGFWGCCFERSFTDVRMFNQHAPSYRNQNMDSCYIYEKWKGKKRIFERRILEVEHATFTPLVFSITGGMARECTVFYKCLSIFSYLWQLLYLILYCCYYFCKYIPDPIIHVFPYYYHYHCYCHDFIKKKQTKKKLKHNTVIDRSKTTELQLKHPTGIDANCM